MSTFGSHRGIDNLWEMITMTTFPAGIAARSCASAADLEAIDAMTALLPNALHRIGLPWRLSSTAIENYGNTRLWVSPNGMTLAWAILQFPWHCLDYEIVPGSHYDAVEATILDWAVSRLAAEATRRGTELPFYVSARVDDSRRLSAIQTSGFKSADWSYIHMARSLLQPTADPVLPDGFFIRPLQGPAEVDAYVDAHRAAFGSTNMTSAWRERSLQHPRYTPDLDLVVTAPDGTIAAFCFSWLLRSDTGAMVQVEPLGVRPAFQRRGLGRTMLTEVFRRARDMQADSIEIDAESYNSASRGLYTAAGFREVIATPFALRVFRPA